MRRYLLFLAIGLSVNLNLSAVHCLEKPNGTINDGPYIFFTDSGIELKWIENDVFKGKNITPENFDDIKKKFGLLFSYNDLMQVNSLKPEFTHHDFKADSIAVIGDIHGEYDTYISLLKASGIIDKNLNWKFGSGHLVVLGDIFDRGDMVTEVLWHLFGLEKQAAEAGGMVHVLLGNHELLVLNRNLRYINVKYANAEIISGARYYDLYSGNSVLGKWLRSKPVIITIDSIIFVHAGISMEMIRRNLNFEQINRKFYDNIPGKDINSATCDEEMDFLNKDYGPLWYRGYFADTSFCENKLDSILQFYGKKHIVVGHTVNKEINSLFNTKILGVDTGIMYRQSPEMLLYKNGSFFKSLSNGKRIKL